MKETKPLTRQEYGSKYYWNAQEQIRNLVLKEELELSMTGNVEGKLGQPIPQAIEWNVYEKRNKITN